MYDIYAGWKDFRCMNLSISTYVVSLGQYAYGGSDIASIVIPTSVLYFDELSWVGSLAVNIITSTYIFFFFLCC